MTEKPITIEEIVFFTIIAIIIGTSLLTITLTQNNEKSKQCTSVHLRR